MAHSNMQGSASRTLLMEWAAILRRVADEMEAKAKPR